jgi:transcription antitermination factor NusG
MRAGQSQCIVETRDTFAEMANSAVVQLRRRRIADEGPDLFPSNVLCCDYDYLAAKSPVSCDDHIGCHWWVAHTKPQQEKLLAKDLVASVVPFYVPLIRRKSLVRGRTRLVRVPLFPGYVFVRGGDEDRLRVLKTNRVMTVWPVPDGEKLRQDLVRFANLIAADAPLLPESRLVPGERVRVKAGPFRGHEGIVLRRDGKTRLLVSIDYLQQGASLEVDDCFLERV